MEPTGLPKMSLVKIKYSKLNHQRLNFWITSVLLSEAIMQKSSLFLVSSQMNSYILKFLGQHHYVHTYYKPTMIFPTYDNKMNSCCDVYRKLRSAYCMELQIETTLGGVTIQAIKSVQREV